jgi:acid stress-induced BolA-like protein IbaG/YrbA
MTTDELNEYIQDEIPGSQVSSTDLTGGGNHFEVLVVYSGFEGRSLLQCQRQVMDVLAPLFQGPLHAATIKTLVRSPE